MSYILDALRKADAERERDPARGIHAQPLAGLPAPEREPRSHAWIAGAAGGLALAAGFVYLSQPAAPPAPARTAVIATAPAPAPVVAAPAVVAPPAPVVTVVPVATAVLPAAPPAAPPAPPAAPRPVAVAPKSQRAEAVAAAPAAAGQVVAGPATPVAPAPTPATAQPALVKAPATEAATRVLALKDLPAEVQRELPKLAISGGVHSDNAAQRMLIVGGQVFAEGAVLAPGVVLEQIRARAAVLQFRGYRFTVGY